MAGARITGPQTRNDAPSVDDWGLVVRLVGGAVIVGPVAVTQGTVPWVVSDPAVEASLDTTLSSRASEATLLALSAIVAAGLDVPLSTRLSDATFTARINTLGQKAMAASTPVVIANDQSAIPISAAALPLPAGAATDAGLAAIFARQADGSQLAAITNFPAVQPVSGPLTDAQLRAVPVPVSGTVSTGGLTDAELRATPVPVSGPLTDAQLRAVAVPVSAAALPLPAGAATEATLALIKAKTDNLDVALSTRAVTGLTDAELRAVPVPVSGTVTTTGLTDAELRATPVPVSGTVSTGGLTDAELRATPVPVSGPLTDAQLRAAAVPISAAALPLPAGAATEATLALIKAKTDNLDVALSTRAVTGLTDAQLRAAAVPVSAAALPLPAGAATEATLATRLADATFTARINTQGQKTMAASTPVVIASDQAAVPISAAALPLPAGAATEATLALIKAKTDNLDVALSTRAVTGLTDAQLRATAVPVSGPLTDAQLRAAAVPISAAALPLPAGAATEATLALIKAKTDNLDVALSTRAVTGLTDAQLRAAAVPISAAALPLPAGAATEATLALIKAKTDNLDVALSTRAVTGLTDAQLRATPVPVSGTVSTGGLTDAELRATPVPVSGPLTDAQLRAAAVPVSAAALPLPAGAATEATLATRLAEATFTARINTQGQKTMAASTPVVIASDQSAIPVTTSALDVAATGTLNANGQTVILALAGRMSTGFQFVYTNADMRLNFEVSGDGGVTYGACTAQQVSDGSSVVISMLNGSIGVGPSFTGSQRGTIIITGGATHVRVRLSNFAAGSVDVTLAASVVEADVLAMMIAGAASGTAAIPVVDSTVNTTLGTMSAKLPASLGQKTSAASLAVVLSSNQVYAEDSAHVSGDTLMLAGVVQQAADAALSNDGDRSLLQVDATGFLKANLKAWLGSTAPTVGQKTLANSIPIAIASDQVYAEDSAHVSGDTVTMAGVVQQAADAALSNDGDRSLLQVDATGFLKANLKAWLGSTAPTVGQKAMANSIPVAIASDQSVLSVVGAAVHDAPVSGAPVLGGGYASAAAPADVSADGDAVRAWFLRNGAQAAVLTAAGALIGGDAANGLDVDVTRMPAGMNPAALGQGTAAQGIRVALASDQVYAEDSAHVSGDTVTMAGVVQQTADAALSNDGDRSLIQVDATGFLKANLKAWLGSTAPTVGQKAMASSIPVVIASDQSNLVVVQPGPAWSGVYAVNVRQSAATAAGAIVWGLLNTDAAKVVSIMSIQLQMFFDGTAAATLMKYEIVKYTGCTAMTTGTAVTAMEKRTSQAPVSTCKVLDTGIAQTAGTAQAVVPIGIQGRVTQLATAFSSIQRDILGVTQRSPFSMAIELAQNELLAIRQSAVSVVGDNVVGFVEVAEL